MKRPVLAFVALMAADAVLTSIGIGRVGIAGELNPVALALYAAAGLAGLWLAKVAITALAVALVARFGKPWHLVPVIGFMALVVALDALTVSSVVTL